MVVYNHLLSAIKDNNIGKWQVVNHLSALPYISELRGYLNTNHKFKLNHKTIQVRTTIHGISEIKPGLAHALCGLNLDITVHSKKFKVSMI